mmetsp:Transcript_3200/g.11589  ORF Transcript_3200/g.11589 Transcript_3200/m.11589 type:complete len:557 (+) Transcript_3200:312-1982(+)
MPVKLKIAETGVGAQTPEQGASRGKQSVARSASMSLSSLKDIARPSPALSLKSKTLGRHNTVASKSLLVSEEENDEDEDSDVFDIGELRDEATRNPGRAPAPTTKSEVLEEQKSSLTSRLVSKIKAKDVTPEQPEQHGNPDSATVDLMPAFQQFNKTRDDFDGFEYVEREFAQLPEKRVRSRAQELNKLKTDAKAVRMSSFQQNYGVFISTAQGLAMIESHLNPLRSKLDDMEDVRARLSGGSTFFANMFKESQVLVSEDAKTKREQLRLGKNKQGPPVEGRPSTIAVPAELFLSHDDDIPQTKQENRQLTPEEAATLLETWVAQWQFDQALVMVKLMEKFFLAHPSNADEDEQIMVRVTQGRESIISAISQRLCNETKMSAETRSNFVRILIKTGRPRVAQSSLLEHYSKMLRQSLALHARDYHGGGISDALLVVLRLAQSFVQHVVWCILDCSTMLKKLDSISSQLLSWVGTECETFISFMGLHVQPMDPHHGEVFPTQVESILRMHGDYLEEKYGLSINYLLFREWRKSLPEWGKSTAGRSKKTKGKTVTFKE